MTEIQKVTDEQLLAALLAGRGELARLSFDLDAYAHFHWCAFRHELEDHEAHNLAAYFDAWNKGDEEGLRGVMNKAARGTYKSTDTMGFCFFVIGHFPHLSNLMVQARDDDAKKAQNFALDLIANSSGWKACFPNVVPDKERGWSENGCHVKKTHDLTFDGKTWVSTEIPYGDWIQKVVSDHKRDPSFMSVTVSAGAIGMHPTGCLILDDIHDTKNTESLASMNLTVKTVKADIIPTMTRKGRKPIFLVAYTPWKFDDTYGVLERSDLFTQLYTPAYELDPTGVEFDGKKVKLTCPSIYSVKALEQQMKLLGRREFNRQILCSLDLASGTSLPYYAYELSGNEFDWIAYGGCDPTATEPDRLEGVKKRSYFALAYVVENPQGGALILDGVLEQVSHSEGEERILRAQEMFPRWKHTLIENVPGAGSAFLQNARRNPKLRVVGSDVYSLDEKGNKGAKSKDDRILQMAQWFENGNVKIAKKESPFLDALRYLFDHFWELNKNYPHPAWDAGDATYHALKAVSHLFVTQGAHGDLPDVFKAKRPHILAGVS